MDTNNTVCNRYYRAFIASFRSDIELVDALLDNLANLRWIQLLHALFLNPMS